MQLSRGMTQCDLDRVLTDAIIEISAFDLRLHVYSPYFAGKTQNRML
jgi:hypothetical protein